MKLNHDQIQEIKDRFSKIGGKTDLLDLLNFTKDIICIKTESSRPIRLSTLSWYANPTLSKGKRYIEFEIPKKNGESRKIHAPARSLKTIQRCLNLILQCVYEPHPAVTGFRPNCSIIDNAQRHTGRNYVYNMDLKNFFPSIELHRVKACFKNPPFNLSGSKEPMAFLLANLCCHELEVERNGIIVKKSVLPQGAPTSPTITNIVANRLDRKLSGLARKNNVEYSRYADDITFSSSHNIYQKDSKFIKELNEIIGAQNFTVNSAKTRLQSRNYRQEVTGLVVNKRVNVTRKYLKDIRFQLHIWEKYGHGELDRLYKTDPVKLEPGKLIISKSQLVLAGKIQFLIMVRGKNDLLCKAYNDRFKNLISSGYQNSGITLDIILDTLEKKGFEQAIEMFNRYQNEQ